MASSFITMSWSISELLDAINSGQLRIETDHLDFHPLTIIQIASAVLKGWPLGHVCVLKEKNQEFGQELLYSILSNAQLCKALHFIFANNHACLSLTEKEWRRARLRTSGEAVGAATITKYLCIDSTALVHKQNLDAMPSWFTWKTKEEIENSKGQWNILSKLLVAEATQPVLGGLFNNILKNHQIPMTVISNEETCMAWTNQLNLLESSQFINACHRTGGIKLHGERNAEYIPLIIAQAIYMGASDTTPVCTADDITTPLDTLYQGLTKDGISTQLSNGIKERLGIMKSAGEYKRESQFTEKGWKHFSKLTNEPRFEILLKEVTEIYKSKIAGS